ncbi:MAG: selenide, water dikinase SelD [Cyanobacteriota bacterium]|nr:selenide, water dikinase SelD [Cyanobacteriota bacterium]
MVLGADSLREHLVLAGGGHSHALVLRIWAMNPQRRPKAWITLVNRRSTALYSGMVPGLVAGLYERREAAIDLRRLADLAGVSFVEAEITAVNLPRQQLELQGRAPLRFDWLSLDLGAVVDGEPPAGGGSAREPLPVKPLEPFLQWCEATPAAPGVLVQGSGAAAVEIALALKARGLHPELHTKPGGLSLGSTRANRLLERVLLQAGVSLQRAGASSGIGGVRIACTGSRAPAWLAGSGLPVDSRGRVLTTRTLQVEGQPRLFASGDCGVVARDPRPPSGVWAVRVAAALAGNLERALQGQPLHPWRPQRLALQLLGDGGVQGPPRAVALWGPLAFGPSRWLWRWKDWIDRRFMQRFQSLQPPPSMAPAAPMACRGCAAKLAAQPLEEALGRLAQGPPAAAEDAALVAEPAHGELWLQSVDGFPALLSDPWLNGRLTALHACSDLWASGARVSSAQAVVTLPVLAGALQADLLHQSLAGVLSVLEPLEARLLGGHTLEARDALPVGPGMPCPGLGLSLTINGRAPRGRCWPKGPLKPGWALILSRPIGSGVLFAAATAGQAQPEWLDHALGVMQQSQAPLLELLAAHGCVACTDITGFGLLGHLGEMLDGTTAVTLLAEAIPALPGALELLAAGQASSLAPANSRALALLQGPVQLVGNAADRQAVEGLLIDPQTCGPLLAAVPEEKAEAALEALRRGGFEAAALIGSVTA